MTHRRGLLFMLFLLLFGQIFRIVISVAFFTFYSPLREMGIDLNAVFESPWMIIFVQIMTLLVPLAIWLGILRENVNQHLPCIRLGKLNILLIVGISLMLIPAMNVISGITTFFFPNEIGEIMQGMVQNHTLSLLLLMLLAVAVTPAICEEVVFRGYLQSTYKNKSFWTMALMNGLFFAVVHSPQQFFYCFVMGIIFSYMVHTTRSIRAAVISHFVLNASSILLLWVATWILEVGSRFVEYYTEYQPEIEMVYESNELLDFIMALMFWGVIAIFSTTAAAFMLREFSAHNKKRIVAYEAKLAEEASIIAQTTVIEPTTNISDGTIAAVTPAEIPKERKINDTILDAALVLVIVTLYVILAFA